MNYKKHEFNFFPEMSDDDFTNLKSSISKGFNETLGKIILFNNEVLDGWNRYRACLETETEPIFENFEGTEQDAFDLSINANQDRRHLTKSQLAAIAIDAEPLWKAIQDKVENERRRKIAEARARQEEEKRERERLEVERKMQAIRRENERIKREKELKEKLQLEADEREKQRIRNEEIKIEQERENERVSELERIEREKEEKETLQLIVKSDIHSNSVQTKLATTFGTNRQYISEAKKLKATNPEAFESVKRGDKTITEVVKEIKIEKRKVDIEKQKADIAAENLPVINQKFDILAIDPPWSYGRKFDPETSRVANPYPEMSIEQIKAIELPSKDDSIVFLWTTHQFLPEAFGILKHWGYDYKATMVWNKERIGMGYWLRMQCEFCLLAVKGKPLWDITDWRDIFSETRREHSRKPDSFFEDINKHFPYASKLEYFSREQRDSWAVFGNDINKF